MKNPSDLIWLDVYDHMFWMTYETYGVRFGEEEEDAYNFGIGNAFLTIFDSGTSTIYVPFSLWKSFISRIKSYAGIKFGTFGSFYTYDCRPQKFPTIYLLVDGYWLEFFPHDYLLDASDAGDHSLCIFAF